MKALHPFTPKYQNRYRLVLLVPVPLLELLPVPVPLLPPLLVPVPVPVLLELLVPVPVEVEPLLPVPEVPELVLELVPVPEVLPEPLIEPLLLPLVLLEPLIEVESLLEREPVLMLSEVLPLEEPLEEPLSADAQPKTPTPRAAAMANPKTYFITPPPAATATGERNKNERSQQPLCRDAMRSIERDQWPMCETNVETCSTSLSHPACWPKLIQAGEFWERSNSPVEMHRCGLSHMAFV